MTGYDGPTGGEGLTTRLPWSSGHERATTSGPVRGPARYWRLTDKPSDQHFVRNRTSGTCSDQVPKLSEPSLVSSLQLGGRGRTSADEPGTSSLLTGRFRTSTNTSSGSTTSSKAPNRSSSWSSPALSLVCTFADPERRRTAGFDPAAALALRIAAVAGARRAELAALRWSDLAGDQLTIDSAIETKRHGRRGDPMAVTLTDAPTKTANRRVVVLDRDTVETIEALMLDRQHLGLWMLSDTDEPVNPDRIGAWWRRARKAAGIDPAWRLHDLRHWSATVAITGGHDVRTVAGRLGHANPAMTLRVYAHAVEAAERAAPLSHPTLAPNSQTSNGNSPRSAATTPICSPASAATSPPLKATPLATSSTPITNARTPSTTPRRPKPGARQERNACSLNTPRPPAGSEASTGNSPHSRSPGDPTTGPNPRCRPPRRRVGAKNLRANLTAGPGLLRRVTR
ncbi:MAG: hypothetical protein QOJ23_5874 [Actinomycetota bacterium]|nr:hypothetical protein [Actinomycetota bacterium]